MNPIFYSDLTKETLVELVVRRNLLAIGKANLSRKAILIDILSHSDEEQGFKNISEANRGYIFTVDNFSQKSGRQELAIAQANKAAGELEKEHKKVKKVKKALGAAQEDDESLSGKVKKSDKTSSANVALAEAGEATADKHTEFSSQVSLSEKAAHEYSVQSGEITQGNADGKELDETAASGQTASKSRGKRGRKPGTKNSVKAKDADGTSAADKITLTEPEYAINIISNADTEALKSEYSHENNGTTEVTLTASGNQETEFSEPSTSKISKKQKYNKNKRGEAKARRSQIKVSTYTGDEFTENAENLLKDDVYKEDEAQSRETAELTSVSEHTDDNVAGGDLLNTEALTEENLNTDFANPGEQEKKEAVSGVLDIVSDGYGFLRSENYNLSSNDYFVSPQLIRRFNLREGDFVSGYLRKKRDNERYQAISFIKEVNGLSPEKLYKRPHFGRLVPIYTEERYTLETGSLELSTRIIDLICPIGKGQRGMIVSPPKAGKTILLQKIADAISQNNKEAHLIVLLIDERPEEVTDMQRRINGEVVYSTFDQTAENHVRITELVLERAKRLVELGQDVVILLDSITRLARAYNLTINPTGRTLSGGLDPGALHGPKRFFGAARKIEHGGSLTIVATALVETGSRMDEVIFEEFKGTGNMEVFLDRKLSEKRIFPAIDINRSGTRREELLLSERELDCVWSIRKAMGKIDPASVTELILNFMQRTKNNNHFVEGISMSLNDKDIIESLLKKNGNGNKSSMY